MAEVGSKLSEQPFVKLDHGNVIWGGTAHSMRDALKIGEFRNDGAPLQTTINPNYTYDKNADDALNRALNQVEKNVAEKIQGDPEMQRILKLHYWDHSDRQSWEARLNEVIVTEIQKIPALAEYRSKWANPDGNFAFNFFKYDRSARLNDLSGDIDNGTKKYEYDCEAESIVSGIVMQRLEDKILPPSPSSEGNLKFAMDYRYVTGLHRTPLDPGGTPHAMRSSKIS